MNAMPRENPVARAFIERRRAELEKDKEAREAKAEQLLADLVQHHEGSELFSLLREEFARNEEFKARMLAMAAE